MGVVVLILSYLLGAIPFGLIVGKLWANLDVRDYGSKNIGVSNVLRTVGPWAALIVLVFDVGKGSAAVVLASRLFEDEATWRLLAGIAAIAGHNWPIFLKFRGGKGVATTAGVLFALAPVVGLLLFIVWVITLAISKYISLSSMMAAIALPLLFYLLGFPNTYLGLSIIVSFFVIYRHRPNIHRLLAGTEYKFGEKGRKN